MTFVHPLLLGGLLLVGIPVLIHLMMQQKPKRLAFPAFRFLVQKHRTNQRRLRVRHFLLLALRMLLIGLLGLALARPKVFNERINLQSGQPVAVALIIDTSMSMEYTEGGKTRLDEAKRRARELLDDLPDNSRVAIFDTAEFNSGEWSASLARSRERIQGLDLRAANGPVTDTIAEAYQILHSINDEPEQHGEPMPRFLYVFSDRTEACWDSARLPQLQALRDRLFPDDKGTAGKVLAAFVDVGVARPIDLAITDLKLPRQIVPANGRFIVQANVKATNKDYDTEITCRIDGEKTPQRRAIQVKAGRNEWVPFDRPGLAKGLHQAEIGLAAPDNLPFNNARFVTFEVTGTRQMLTISDDPADALAWQRVLQIAEDAGDLALHCEVKSTRDAMEMPAADLARYKAVCLLSVAAPEPELWQKLWDYVKGGGGLAIIPGGAELNTARYSESEWARNLMPGQITSLVRTAPDKGVPWDPDRYQAPLKGWFAERERYVDPQGRQVDFIVYPPTTVAYWDVKVGPEAFLLAVYKDDKHRPALLERKLDRKQVHGRVLLFTTPLDLAALKRDWNDYLKTSFYLALSTWSLGYLTGDAQDVNLNHLCRPQQPVMVALPPEGRFPTYDLQLPRPWGQAVRLARSDQQTELRLNEATLAGNYVLVGGADKWRTGFSLNVPPEECQLSQVPVEQIEALFGPGSVLPIGRDLNFRDALQGHWSQPVELLPWLMILLLLALAAENLLANRFYRQSAEANETDEGKTAG